MTATRFDVAFVCTGNRFRSPLAAALLAAETNQLPVRVESAGILDVGPTPALPEAVAAARTFGIDLSGHRARALKQVDLQPFDLVLGFELLHVRAAVGTSHAPAERTFVLPELVHLLEALPAPPVTETLEWARRRIQQANRLRAEAGSSLPAHDVPDPIGRPASVQRRTAEEVRELVSRLTRALFR